jgi:transglutaminase-like putative cysteine protease
VPRFEGDQKLAVYVNFKMSTLLEGVKADERDAFQIWVNIKILEALHDLLADLNCGVASWISYQSRETEGTQTPVETLNRGWGSCRDFAVLLIEAARSLGFGARIVTGYLYNPTADGHSTIAIGSGTTHAWADIYLPGAGWVAYDPTNGKIGGADLIRVAVTRDIDQAVPIAGSFIGTPSDFIGMTVDVAVATSPPSRQN